MCAEFLSPLGYTAVAVMKKNDVWIPLLFDSAFKRLNELLRPAGFDFSKWRGYRAAVYECVWRRKTARRPAQCCICTANR